MALVDLSSIVSAADAAIEALDASEQNDDTAALRAQLVSLRREVTATCRELNEQYGPSERPDSVLFPDDALQSG